MIERLTAAAALRQGCGAMMRRAATAGAVNGDPMVRIADLNAPAPMSGDIAAAQVEMACGNHAISLGLAIVISISGRQRMLSQKNVQGGVLARLGHRAGRVPRGAGQDGDAVRFSVGRAD